VVNLAGIIAGLKVYVQAGCGFGKRHTASPIVAESISAIVRIISHDYFPSLSLRLANATPASMQATHIIANTLNGIYCDKSKAIVIPSLLLTHNEYDHCSG
jgi:hypothetical protein